MTKDAVLTNKERNINAEDYLDMISDCSPYTEEFLPKKYRPYQDDVTFELN